MTAHEEWRVTGRHSGMTFDLTCHFRTVDDARAWITKRSNVTWDDGPYLHRRTVTFTEWEAL